MTDTVPESIDLVLSTAEVVEPDEAWAKQQRKAAELAEGLRTLARFVDDNPQLAEHLEYPLGYMNAPVNDTDSPRETVAQFARAALRLGGEVSKNFSDDFAGVTVTFGPVEVQVYSYRADICERVVVGTREVVKEVRDPEALAAVPMVKTTVTEDVVEWRCTPLLADEPVPAEAAA